MMSKEELIRHRLEDASRRIQFTVEERAKISRRRSGTITAKSVGLQVGSEANDEGATLSQRRASLGNKEDGMPSLSADHLLQRRLREARERIRTTVHEASITNDDEPKSSSERESDTKIVAPKAAATAHGERQRGVSSKVLRCVSPR